MKSILSISLLLVSLAIAGETPIVIADNVRDKLPKPLIDVIVKAEEDYKAVQDGKEPIHAKYIERSYTLDGGSKVYQGERYKITRQHRLIKVGDIPGVIYGPILRFEDDIVFASDLSNLRFYSRDEYSKLTKKEAEQPAHGDAEESE